MLKEYQDVLNKQMRDQDIKFKERFDQLEKLILNQKEKKLKKNRIGFFFSL